MGYIGKTPTPQPLTATDIPDLPATKITSGTFPALNGSNLTNLDAADLTGTLPAISGANLTGVSAGKVLQVVSAENSSERSTSSSSFSLVVEASITPASTSNKILIICGLAGIRRDSGNGYLGARVSDGSSFNKKFTHAALYDGGSGAMRIATANASFLHSPNTTSAKTYTVQFNSTSNAATVVVGDNGDSNSTITLMEIEA